MMHRHLLTFTLGISFILTACAPVMQSPAPDRWLIRQIGLSVQSRAIECLEAGTGSTTVLFIASIHGSEPAGTPLLAQLRDHLNANPVLMRHHRIILIPIANPDGHAQRMRFNTRKVDLNRNFPADNRRDRKRFGLEPLSEPESRALHDLILTEKPASIVSIHQPIQCIDYDGPAVELAQRMSGACGLPVKKLGAQPGSLGAWAGVDLGLSVITFELPPHAEHEPGPVLWDRYGAALLEALR